MNKHCQQSILEANRLARNEFREAKERDTLSTVCLLQDIGKLVSWHTSPSFIDLCATAQTGEKCILELESETYGCDHAQVGAPIGTMGIAAAMLRLV